MTTKAIKLRNVYLPYSDLTEPTDPANAHTILEDPGLGIVVLTDTRLDMDRAVIVYGADHVLACASELDEADEFQAQLCAHAIMCALSPEASRPARTFNGTVGHVLADALDRGERLIESAARIEVTDDIRYLLVEDPGSSPIAFVHGPSRDKIGYTTHLVRSADQFDRALNETTWEASLNDPAVCAWRDHLAVHLPDNHLEEMLTLSGRQGFYVGVGLADIKSEVARTARVARPSPTKRAQFN